MASGACSVEPLQCTGLSLGERRKFVHEVVQQSKDASEILSSFTRKELREIICVEMGKEIKYSGYSKLRMIEQLQKLISQKPKRSNDDGDDNIVLSSSGKTGNETKRQRRKGPQLRLSTELDTVCVESNKEEHVKIQVCKNVACRAALRAGDAFCKRCSCCICHYYDDNKDPSLWITCSSDYLGENSCGLTCHLICALKDERAEIMKTACRTKLDGSFFCVSCGKVNQLMSTWRKQLLIAKEARRVDVLCLRVLLGCRILKGTERYKDIRKTIKTALQLLKNELGPLDLVCAKMARGIVNRLSCGSQVQKLCASAMENFDSMFTNHLHNCVQSKETVSCQIRFEESSPTSVIVVLEYIESLFTDLVGCMLSHRKSTVKDYPENPTLIIMRPEKRFKIADLTPSTEYFCKASFFSSTGVLGVWEANWSTPTSEDISAAAADADGHRKEENTTIAEILSQEKLSYSSDAKLAFLNYSKQQLLPADVNTDKIEGLSSGLVSPSTPNKSTGVQEISDMSSRKRMEESAYEYSVRVVKWLEHEGHIDGDFRVKFLTWFSLKATLQERRVVNVFVDALVDDPPSLAEQLIHTFTDEICIEQKPAPQQGFCPRLWHSIILEKEGKVTGEKNVGIS